MEWYVRYKVYWKRATEKQKTAVTNYLETHNQNQIIDEPVIFRDFKHKNNTIYVVYTCGITLVELLFDTPEHVAYMNKMN
jgi:hypothetical protein